MGKRIGKGMAIIESAVEKRAGARDEKLAVL